MSRLISPASLLVSALLVLQFPGLCLPQTGRTLLEGRLENSGGLSLQLYYTNSRREESDIMITLTDGEFSIPDSIIVRPQIAVLYLNKKGGGFTLPIALARGYDLSLKANMLDYETFSHSVEWTGPGSSANKFYTAVNNYRMTGRQDYHESGETRFEDWYRRSKAGTDSLFTTCSRIYDKKQEQEFDFFKNIIREDILFRRLDELMKYAGKLLDQKSPLETEKYVHAHFDVSILKNISDARYLSSPGYQEMMAFSYSYLFYIFKYDRKVRPDTTANVYGAYLSRIEASFKGPVRDFVFFKFINLNLLTASNSYDKFHVRAGLTRPFLKYITSRRYRKQLENSIAKKENELASLKAGDQAPVFSLKDKDGSFHTLAADTGKIVVLDFWASWCWPCRHETPYLKALSEKYKADNRIAFISIAVRDTESAWLKALEEDKPGWLQLFDSTGRTAGEYFTNAIPKFVVIDGQGKILNFDAPAPSGSTKFEDILKAELKKM